MKNLFLILIVISLIQCTDRRTEYIGTFKNDPDYILGFKKPMTERQKKLFARLSWSIIISENYLSIYTGDKGPLKLDYFVKGKFVVGKDLENGNENYYPIYFSDENTAFIMGQKFIRVKNK